MSYSFSIYLRDKDGNWRMKERCVCYELEEAISFEAWEYAEPYTYDDPRTVEHPLCKVCADTLNIANGNAVDFLHWLGLDPDIDAEPVPAKEVAALCRRRLWPEAINDDPGRPGEVLDVPGKPKVIVGGRPAGRFKTYAEKLLKTAERAGDDFVGWG